MHRLANGKTIYQQVTITYTQQGHIVPLMVHGTITQLTKDSVTLQLSEWEQDTIIIPMRKIVTVISEYTSNEDKLKALLEVICSSNIFVNELDIERL